MKAVSVQRLHGVLAVERLNSAILGTFVQIGQAQLR